MGLHPEECGKYGRLARIHPVGRPGVPNMEAVSLDRMRQLDDPFRGEAAKGRGKSHSGRRTGCQRPLLQDTPYRCCEPTGPDECVSSTQNDHSRKGNHYRFITEKRAFSSWAQM
ncbi:hypothetical protein CB1_001402135 [Camelus ferus]|nr:hypothetical protein CB1_001402135 [Camelus ferus]